MRRRMILLGILTGLVAAWAMTDKDDELFLAPVVSQINREAIKESTASDTVATEAAAPARAPAKAPAKIEPAEEIKVLRSSLRFNLSAIYVAQKTYFNEYHRYTSDLLAAGWTPQVKEVPFRGGFLKEYIPESYDDLYFREDPRRMNTEILFSDPQMGDAHHLSETAAAIRLSDYEHLCQRDCGVHADGFEFMVAAPLPNGQVDVWTINDKKELRHVRDGLADQP